LTKQETKTAKKNHSRRIIYCLNDSENRYEKNIRSFVVCCHEVDASVTSRRFLGRASRNRFLALPETRFAKLPSSVAKRLLLGCGAGGN